MVDYPTAPSSGGASSTIINGSSEKRTEEESSTTTSIAGVEKIIIDQPSQLVENGASPPEQPGDNDSSDAEPNDNGTGKKVYAVSVRWEREQREREAIRQRHRGRPPSSQQQSSSSNPITESDPPCLTFTIEDFNRYCCCCAHRVGSMFFLVEREDGSPIIVAGPCWPFCSFVTVPLIVGCSALVGYFIVSNPNTGLPWWFGLIYYPIVIFVLSVLFCVSCRDPGLMERVIDEEAAENGWFWNEQVGSYRPAGAMYCRECKALVHDYDHVCPWTGTAIGKGNMKPFKMFVFSVNVLCYLSIGLVIWQVLSNIT